MAQNNKNKKRKVSKKRSEKDQAMGAIPDMRDWINSPIKLQHLNDPDREYPPAIEIVSVPISLYNSQRLDAAQDLAERQKIIEEIKATAGKIKDWQQLDKKLMAETTERLRTLNEVNTKVEFPLDKGDKYRRRVYRDENGLSEVYDVADAWNLPDALSHALKKILLPGGRGAKSRVKDLQEAIVSIERQIKKELDNEKRNPDEAGR